MNQLYARPTGDQKVAGSIPAEPHHCFVETDQEIFSTVILSHPLASRVSWMRVRLTIRRSQEVPARSGSIISRRYVTKYFLRSFSLLRRRKTCSCQFLTTVKNEVYQFLGKECAQVLVNCFED